MKKCGIAGCDKTQQYLKRGWCNNHYEKFRRTGSPMGSGRRSPAQVERDAEAGVKACKKCGEVKPLSEFYRRLTPSLWYYTNCKACHDLYREARQLAERLANPPVPRTPIDHGPCAFEGCRNKGRSRLSHRGGPEGWFCNPHWIQWDKHEELVPLRDSSRSYINDKFRLCTACETVKPQNDFYARTTGGTQSQCKECQYKVARLNALLREGRYNEARGIARTMPVAIREKYMARVSNAIKSDGRGEES